MCHFGLGLDVKRSRSVGYPYPGAVPNSGVYGMSPTVAVGRVGWKGLGALLLGRTRPGTMVDGEGTGTTASVGCQRLRTTMAEPPAVGMYLRAKAPPSAWPTSAAPGA